MLYSFQLYATLEPNQDYIIKNIEKLVEIQGVP